ncbi:MAG: AraC family transcriptional regulator [Butyrivibrio sp.]|nr:AraC family transcriptional regulator [Butyrivibrio sp.]
MKTYISKIEMAQSYIRTNYEKSLSLMNVAALVDLNPSYFSNLFKLKSGMKFSDYVFEVRMERAIELLKDPRLKVYEIGNAVGYEDAPSFGRAFRKKFHMSPNEYRNFAHT